MNGRRLFSAAAVFVLMVPFLAGCSEQPDGSNETALPERPDDKLIEATGQPEAVDRDPTPQTGTGGLMQKNELGSPATEPDP